MPTLIPTVTITLPADEAAVMLGSLRQSLRPKVRALGDRLGSMIEIPLFCPVGFKEGNADLCGIFSGEVFPDKDASITGLRDHLLAIHGVESPDRAEYEAAVAFKRWAPVAE